jgi:hypothetical protein
VVVFALLNFEPSQKAIASIDKFGLAKLSAQFV